MLGHLEEESCFPRYALACLQMAADGYTSEDTAKYIGYDPEFVEDLLSSAKKCLGASTLSQAVAVGLTLGFIT